MSEILLKVGNGELEIIEFMINGQFYGINVLKVREIIPINEVIKVPKASEEIAGLAHVRGKVSVVIDLQQLLCSKPREQYQHALGLLCEFNGTQVIFLVDYVEQIKRISWKDINPIEQISEKNLTIGTILSDGHVTVMLDFESIAIGAKIGKGYETQGQKVQKNHRLKNIKIVLAEDSKAICEMLRCTLEEAGFRNIKIFNNGQEAKNYIYELKNQYGQEFYKKIDLLISDIEMPVLDGYSLIKWIKSDETLQRLKVILFSSLITEELKHKGMEVGADSQISKPSIKVLVEEINRLMGR